MLTSLLRDYFSRRVLAAAMVAVVLVHPVKAQIAATHAPAAVGPANGTLVLDGGPEATSAVARRFIELAGGDKARIVLIPSAAGDEVAQDPATLTKYRRLFGSTCCTILHAARRAQADSLAFVESLASATGVWMMGGQPSLLADTYWHTRTEAALRALLARGGVVGGSSAGATVQGARIPTKHPDHGFGFLREAFVMAHLDRNNARDMLVRIVREDSRTLGIGVSEHTAAIITGDRLEVLGAGEVVIVNGQEHAGKAFLTLRSGESASLAPRSIGRP